MFINALKLLNWEGRICRRQYLIAFILICAAMVFSMLFLAVITGGDEGAMSVASLFVMLLGQAFLIPSQIKRLHDIGWSGAAVLLFFLPIVNVILGFGLLLFSGTKGPNAYGEDPHNS